jgi:hypothetical protein
MKVSYRTTEGDYANAARFHAWRHGEWRFQWRQNDRFVLVYRLAEHVGPERSARSRIDRES